MDYDAIVVGSGFGGTIATTMLAETGKRVLVLERGTWWMSPEDGNRPPSETTEMRAWLDANEQRPQYWPRGNHLRGLLALFACARTRRNRKGLYQWSRFKDVSVVTSSAVGGGSMIYSNVSRRAPQPALDAIGLRLGQPDYDAAIRWMERFRGPLNQIVTRIPLAHQPGVGQAAADYLYLDRSRVLRDAAAKVAARRPDASLSWFPLDLSVTEYDPQRGATSGSARHHTFCERQGRCIFGCLPAAKQTLDRSLFVHVSDPHPRVELSSLAEARLIRRIEGGYEVEYRDHRHRRRKKRATAPLLFLAAGTLGTTELLLRSRQERGIELSERLGHGFSTNGDFGGFIKTDARVKVNSAHGPINTSGVSVIIHGRHFTFEDTGIPSVVAPLIATTVRLADTIVRRRLVNGKLRLAGLVHALLPELRTVLPPYFPNTSEPTSGPTEAEAVENIFLFHVMGQDDANGTFRLRRGKLDLRWDGDVARQETFDVAGALCKQFAEAMDGTYVELEKALPRGSSLTITHPLGGCGIGESRDEGVVDEYGRVYNPSGASKTAVHEGLYIVDGSAIPGPLAVNPSLTIAAQALKSVTAALGPPGSGRPAERSQPA